MDSQMQHRLEVLRNKLGRQRTPVPPVPPALSSLKQPASVSLGMETSEAGAEGKEDSGAPAAAAETGAQFSPSSSSSCSAPSSSGSSASSFPGETVREAEGAVERSGERGAHVNGAGPETLASVPGTAALLAAASARSALRSGPASAAAQSFADTSSSVRSRFVGLSDMTTSTARRIVLLEGRKKSTAALLTESLRPSRSPSHPRGDAEKMRASGSLSGCETEREAPAEATGPTSRPRVSELQQWRSRLRENVEKQLEEFQTRARSQKVLAPRRATSKEPSDGEAETDPSGARNPARGGPGEEPEVGDEQPGDRVVGTKSDGREADLRAADRGEGDEERGNNGGFHQGDAAKGDDSRAVDSHAVSSPTSRLPASREANKEGERDASEDGADFERPLSKSPLSRFHPHRPLKNAHLRDVHVAERQEDTSHAASGAVSSPEAGASARHASQGREERHGGRSRHPHEEPRSRGGACSKDGGSAARFAADRERDARDERERREGQALLDRDKKREGGGRGEAHRRRSPRRERSSEDEARREDVVVGGRPERRRGRSRSRERRRHEGNARAHHQELAARREEETRERERREEDAGRDARDRGKGGRERERERGREREGSSHGGSASAGRRSDERRREEASGGRVEGRRRRDDSERREEARASGSEGGEREERELASQPGNRTKAAGRGASGRRLSEERRSRSASPITRENSPETEEKQRAVRERDSAKRAPRDREGRGREREEERKRPRAAGSGGEMEAEGDSLRATALGKREAAEEREEGEIDEDEPEMREEDPAQKPDGGETKQNEEKKKEKEEKEKKKKEEKKKEKEKEEKEEEEKEKEEREENEREEREENEREEEEMEREEEEKEREEKEKEEKEENEDEREELFTPEPGETEMLLTPEDGGQVDASVGQPSVEESERRRRDGSDRASGQEGKGVGRALEASRLSREPRAGSDGDGRGEDEGEDDACLSARPGAEAAPDGARERGGEDDECSPEEDVDPEEREEEEELQRQLQSVGASCKCKRSSSLMYGCRRVEIFKKLNKISEGTYGAVFRAMNRTTGEIVALKQIKYHNRLWSEGFPVTSLREISIMLELQHPNVLDVQEVVVGTGQHQVFMVMEYIEHEVKTLLDEKPEFSTAERKCLLYQLLEALAYMHANFVFHRDLKPSNLLYSNRGVLKVADFGMARKFGFPLHNRVFTKNVVTLWYRPPEILLGEGTYDAACDVWAVGAIFGEFLRKKPLFAGHGELDTLNKIFKLCGTPTETSWPEFNSLPHIKNKKFFTSPPQCQPSWREVFPPPSKHLAMGSSGVLTDLGLDLLQKLLELNPAKRITAAEALQHEYFQEKPRPQLKELMPTFPDTNSQDQDSFRFGARVDAEKFLSALADQTKEKKKDKTTGARKGR
ncbi:hypothetical protein NCLIV_001240 [Neospora caninum Liverpool]|uniref:Cyclin-dependent kinase 2 homolog n=1 Tax=Neospora caninum (strain Liverpool) TaxID=572307 RepID=F0V7E3_NEOCL|nr:hypothetical protein NCLIV_001240 [Neospora caninum Liverpool]CBZ49634.1 hypothetical protein NCLIV_001240 [Neospora caninum Liverpool]|eukprot:XP_003879669.1 hypothetical protein NCLIV_001240 [Neospora caninum Liverpool]